MAGRSLKQEEKNYGTAPSTPWFQFPDQCKYCGWVRRYFCPFLYPFPLLLTHSRRSTDSQTSTWQEVESSSHVTHARHWVPIERCHSCFFPIRFWAWSWRLALPQCHEKATGEVLEDGQDWFCCEVRMHESGKCRPSEVWITFSYCTYLPSCSFKNCKQVSKHVILSSSMVFSHILCYTGQFNSWIPEWSETGDQRGV
jgi:hypothetical protein